MSSDREVADVTAVRERLARIYSTVAYNRSAEADKTREVLLLAESLVDRLAATQPSPDGLLRTDRLRARLLQMANVAAEKRPMTDVARGYERACDELLEWLTAASPSGDRPQSEPSELGSLRERVKDVRLLMIDGIASDLFREFAQGDPFEPFDRAYVVKRMTRILDDARDRTRRAALSTEGVTQEGER